MIHRYGRREFIKRMSYGSAGVLGISSLTPILSCRRRTADSRPNIVLIMADDMGYSDIGCYGGEIQTPAIDRLAENGLRFTQFYNTARCCPTRASLLTGLYPHQTGVGAMLKDWGLDGYRGDLNNRCVTIAQVLKQAGYACYVCGKWHVTRFLENHGPKHNWPLQRGFDCFFGTITGAGSYFDPMTLSRDNEWIKLPSEKFYYTDSISENAIKFIKEHRQKKLDVPFFMYIAYTSPHWPLHALEEDIARYKGRFDKGWDVLRKERYKRMIDMQLLNPEWRLTARDSRVPRWEEADHKEWQLRRMEVYAAQVDRMDQGIGRIVAELERGGLLDNTLIFFLADNGGSAEELDESWRNYLLNGGEYVCRETTPDGEPMQIGNNPMLMPGPSDTYQSYGVPWANVSNTPFRLYKTWVHQGGVATPLIVHWPKRIKAKGEFRHQQGHLIDILASCIDVAGASYPAVYKDRSITPMEGKSLVPAFDDKPIEREAIYFEHERNRAVIKGKWKLVAKGKEGPWELYDLEADRTETVDLSSHHPQKVEEMAGMWEDWGFRTKVLPREKS